MYGGKTAMAAVTNNGGKHSEADHRCAQHSGRLIEKVTLSLLAELLAHKFK